MNNCMIKLSNKTQNYMRSWISMHLSKRSESGTVTINPGSMINKECNCVKKEKRKNLVTRSIRILMECLLCPI